MLGPRNDKPLVNGSWNVNVCVDGPGAVYVNQSGPIRAGECSAAQVIAFDFEEPRCGLALDALRAGCELSARARRFCADSFRTPATLHAYTWARFVGWSGVFSAASSCAPDASDCTLVLGDDVVMHAQFAPGVATFEPAPGASATTSCSVFGDTRSASDGGPTRCQTPDEFVPDPVPVAQSAEAASHLSDRPNLDYRATLFGSVGASAAASDGARMRIDDVAALVRIAVTCTPSGFTNLPPEVLPGTGAGAVSMTNRATGETIGALGCSPDARETTDFVRVPPGEYDVHFDASLTSGAFTSLVFEVELRNEYCAAITDDNRAACQRYP